MSDREQETYAAAQLREEIKRDDGADELLPHAGLVQDERAIRHLNTMARAHRRMKEEGELGDIPEDFTETRMYQRVVSQEATKVASQAVNDGNVSQMQNAIGMIDHSDAEGGEAKQDLAATLAREGSIVVVLGEPGSGKTATTLDAARIAATMEGAELVSNVRSWMAVDGENVVTDSGQLVDRLGEIDGRAIAVIDEASEVLRQVGANHQKAERFARQLKKIRKKGGSDRHARQGSVAIIAHTLEGVGAEIRRLLSEAWLKPSARDPGRLEVYEVPPSGNSLGERLARYKGLADTRETFDEHDPAPFDVPARSDGDGDGEGETTDPEEVRRREHIRAALVAVEENDMSYREAATLVPYSKDWVGNRVREWRDGEYRELYDPE